MTKQDIIREGIAKAIMECPIENVGCDGLAQHILNKLHSQDVVIKVEDDNDPISNMGIYPKSVVGGEHPYKKRSSYQNGWNAALMELTKEMVKSDIEYVAVEPLIKEGK